MTDIEFNKFKQEAILRAYYFDLFLKLESKIKDIFNEELDSIDHDSKNKLYFYYGYKHKSTEFFDFENEKLIKEEKPFKQNETFKDFSLINLIKFIRKTRIIKDFEFHITSLNKRTITFPFYDIVIKLIDMRNVLAHVGDKPSFKEKHIIESFSSENLSKHNTFNLDNNSISHAEITNQNILGNLIYMNIVLEKLLKQ